MVGDRKAVGKSKKILFLSCSTVLITFLPLIWNEVEITEYSGLNTCVFSLKGQSFGNVKGQSLYRGVHCREGRVLVFCEDKQVSLIVAKGTEYIFALHLDWACSYRLFFIAYTINDCKSLQILQRPWQSILQQEIYKERGWGGESQSNSLLFWQRNLTLTLKIIEYSMFTASARCITYAKQFQFRAHSKILALHLYDQVM